MQAELAQRQIRKGKRPTRGDSADSSSSATSHSNPFASVHLVAGGAPAAAAGGFSFGAPAATGGFGGFGGFGAAAAPAPAPAATHGAPAAVAGSFGGFGGFGAGAAAAPAPALGGFSFGGAAASTPAPAPAASGGFGCGAAAAPAPAPLGGFGFGAAAAPAPTAAPAAAAPVAKPADAAAPKRAAPPASVEDLKALNAEFLEHLENEWQRGSRCTDWSEAVQQYLDQRDALATVSGRSSTANGASIPAATAPAPILGTAAPAPAPMFGTAAPASAPGGFAFGGGAAAPPAFGTAAPPAFGGFSFGAGVAAPPVLPTLGGFGATAPAAPAPAPAAKPVMASAPLPTAGGEGDAVAKHKCVCKVSVFRQEKKNDQGELIQEKGWKPIGTGQLRLLFDDGVHFVEFRPVVQDGTAAEDAEGGGSDEMIGQKKYGRPVLTARLAATTKFEVNNKAVQVNLSSTDAAGQPVYARYNINIGGVAEAAEFGALANSLCPKA